MADALEGNKVIATGFPEPKTAASDICTNMLIVTDVGANSSAEENLLEKGRRDPDLRLEIAFDPSHKSDTATLLLSIRAPDGTIQTQSLAASELLWEDGRTTWKAMDTNWNVIDVQKSPAGNFDVAYAIAANGWSIDFTCDEQILGKISCKSRGPWTR